jgi:hypothetical protein
MMIVSAYQADPTVKPKAGKSYVIFGKTDTDAVDLSKPRFDYDKRYISVVICDTNKSVTVKTKSW